MKSAKNLKWKRSKIEDDPVIDRIRESRRKISEECVHDSKKLIESYIRRQNERMTDKESQDHLFKDESQDIYRIQPG